MFGYITINKSELSGPEYERFHGYYCGLCRVLKKKYDRRGQALLNYDMAFLVILLTSLYECGAQSIQVRCVPNGGRRHEALVNEMTEYAADMNLALAYHKCMDNWEDEHSRSQRLLARLLESRYEEIRDRYPRQCRAMERELAALSRLEHGLKAEAESCRGECWKRRAEKQLRTAPKAGDADIDSAANCFGRLTAEIFAVREDEWRELLWDIGFSLGKFVYLLDAYDDLEKDRKRGSFNPLLSVAGRPDFDEFCHQMLVMTMADCSKKFEMLPLLEETGILRNVIYSGVWTKYELIRGRRKNGRPRRSR